MRRWGKLVIGVAASAALILGGTVAYADDLALDYDDLVVEDGVTYLDFGDVECDVEATRDVDMVVERNANLNSGRVYQSGSTIAFSLVSVAATVDSGVAVGASAPAPSTVTLSSTWASQPAGSDWESAPASSTISVKSAVEGPDSAVVTYRASGTVTTGATLTQTKSVNVRWNVLSCDSGPEDTTPPVVVLTCPTDPVLLGQPASATWEATDETGFADGTETSGSIDLDTSAYGAATASLPAGFIADAAGNQSEATSCDYFVTENTPPVVTLVCPTAPIILGTPASATWTAEDPMPGSGIDAGVYAVSGSVTLDTSSVGAKTASVAAGTVVDIAGNASLEATCGYSVVFDFDGFFRPVDMDMVNSVKAGSAVPIKFSLGGDQGLDIIAAGYPKVQRYSCSALTNVDAIEETVNAGGSSLSYDPVADQYVYVWKTEKSWAGSCGTLTLKLVDGTEHTANFQFKK
ncbi:PxKF domain-containing protein [Agromyces arachidis]|uniref:PxKF domain-containing protein n=1 Tax=Agromyces arachidis TaxID=766966 RepID=UPI0040574B1D